MPVTIELAVSEDINDEDADVPDLESFQCWADSTCQESKDTVASFRIVGRKEMQVLNKTYRDKNKPTNVLSFPMELPDEINLNLLGDLVLCADVIADEAKQQGKDQRSHWAHMTVHGMLHLQGYDHISAKEAEDMETMEINILGRLGINNPYE